jgi:hypothetical protein
MAALLGGGTGLAEKRNNRVPEFLRRLARAPPSVAFGDVRGGCHPCTVQCVAGREPQDGFLSADAAARRRKGSPDQQAAML